MEKKAMYAILAVLVLVVAGAGIYWFAVKDDKAPADPNQVTFLAEDEYGSFFWMTGTGEKVSDAYADAAAKCNIKIVTHETEWGVSIDSIAGIASADDFSKYWATYVYVDGKWVLSDNGISKMVSSAHDYIGLFYVKNTYPDAPALPNSIPDVKDAKDSKGFTFPPKVTFLVQDDRGNSFWMTGSGEKVADAYISAARSCNIKIVTHETDWGLSIDSIAGLASEADFSKYWATYVYADGKWVLSDDGVSKMMSSAHDYIGLFYVKNTYPDAPALPSSIPDVKEAKDANGFVFPV